MPFCKKTFLYFRRRIKVWFKRVAFLVIHLFFYCKKTFSIVRFSVAEIRSILLIETAFLGDVIAITPAIHSIKEAIPDALVDVLVEKKYTPLLQFERKIEHLYGVNTSHFFSLLKIIFAMRKNSYDLVVCTSPGVKNSFISLFSGKRFITGYLLHPVWETNFFNDFYSVMIGSDITSLYPKQAHLTTRALNSLAPLNLDIDCASSQVRLQLSSVIEKQKLLFLNASYFIKPGKINIVIHPCASWAYKQWPLENMELLIQYLLEQYSDMVHVTLIGIPSEKHSLTKIKKSVSQKIMLLVGTDLLTIMTLIKNADVFIGNDSGPKHIADAFEKPIIELLGPSLPQTVGGKNNKVRFFYENVSCSPCSHQECSNQGLCMRSITVESVLSHLCSIIDSQLEKRSVLP